ncbi:MAG: GMC family oxidoreductase [Cyclobacteriaceae bacterium]|nr:GMC family oxidoreductase [Cyclobacteriaceae bacterium]
MTKNNEYDAIVVGSGITGGWAAKELTEQGLKTLVLERGRDVKHIEDYPTATKNPWEFPHGSKITRETRQKHPVQCTNYAFNEATKHFFVNDLENPFSHAEDKPYRWIRGYQVGGKSMLWARQSYRFSDHDFEANLKDGNGVDWPIRYKDLEPWYDYVEQFIGVSGQNAGLEQLPDGKFQPPMEFKCGELEMKKAVEKNWSDRKVIIGRTANLTQPLPGRSACQYRNMCARGCPFGASFTSNSSTLPAAYKTGNLTLRPYSTVHSLIYDLEKDKVTGVRVIDTQTGEHLEFYAKVIFLCASTLNSTFLLMNSANSRFPEGLANSSGALGHYLMDHHKDINATARFDGFEDKTSYGQRPNAVLIPRFRNIKESHPDFTRGYGIWGSAFRGAGNPNITHPGFGADFKDSITQWGDWNMTLYAYGEILPNYNNRVELNHDLLDKWGLPTLKMTCEIGENEKAMRKDMLEQCGEVLEATGLKDIKLTDGDYVYGFSIHEMGTARMGRDPKSSVLNGFNQCHDIPNVFVTDGACMTSSAWQNPSLTFMALTARACHYAVDLLKKGEL